jgi:hypothetical protein
MKSKFTLKIASINMQDVSGQPSKVVENIEISNETEMTADEMAAHVKALVEVIQAALPVRDLIG